MAMDQKYSNHHSDKHNTVSGGCVTTGYSANGGAGVVSNQGPPTLTDRMQMTAEILTRLDDRLQNVLTRIRGAHPVAMDKDPNIKVQPSPTLESIQRRIENTLSSLEESSAEIDNTI